MNRAILMLLCLWAFSAKGQDQANYQLLTSLEQVNEQLALATEEILLATTFLHNESLADALREALTTRGVPVYLLVPQSSVQENASYATSLAYAGAQVRLSEVGGSFLVIDRRMTLAGDLIGALPTGEEGPTIFVDDEGYAIQFVEGFIEGFDSADVFNPNGEE